MVIISCPVCRCNNNVDNVVVNSVNIINKLISRIKACETCCICLDAMANCRLPACGHNAFCSTCIFAIASHSKGSEYDASNLRHNAANNRNIIMSFMLFAIYYTIVAIRLQSEDETINVTINRKLANSVLNIVLIYTLIILNCLAVLVNLPEVLSRCWDMLITLSHSTVCTFCRDQYMQCKNNVMIYYRKMIDIANNLKYLFIHCMNEIHMSSCRFCNDVYNSIYNSCKRICKSHKNNNSSKKFMNRRKLGKI